MKLDSCPVILRGWRQLRGPAAGVISVIPGNPGDLPSNRKPTISLRNYLQIK